MCAMVIGEWKLSDVEAKAVPSPSGTKNVR